MLGSAHTVGEPPHPPLSGGQDSGSATASPGGLDKAEKQGDEWVINGQKIWTSGAQHADFGILITRSDPNVAKHKGLTMFFLDMKSAGVSVVPIKQANGASFASANAFGASLIGTLLGQAGLMQEPVEPTSVSSQTLACLGAGLCV